MDEATLNELRGLLEARRERLLQLIGETALETRTDEVTTTEVGVGGSPADRGTDLFEREEALTLELVQRRDLDEVERALRKISSGTYGICERSGKPIPVDRLRAIPWARYTVEEETVVEQQRVKRG